MCKTYTCGFLVFVTCNKTARIWYKSWQCILVQTLLPKPNGCSVEENGTWENTSTEWPECGEFYPLSHSETLFYSSLETIYIK